MKDNATLDRRINRRVTSGHGYKRYSDTHVSLLLPVVVCDAEHVKAVLVMERLASRVLEREVNEIE